MFFCLLRLKALADQVRRLDKEGACVAAEAGHDLLRERMQAVVVQIVVVTRVESRSGTRRPAKQCLRSQSRIEGVVVKNQSRKGRLRELIRAAERQDVDVKSNSIRVVPAEALRVDTELCAELVGRLVREAAIKLKQTAAPGIEWRLLAQREGRGTNARILAAVAEV